MAYNYVVSAQQPTAVWSSVSGNFLHPTEYNLVLNKINRLELYGIKRDLIETLNEFDINGRIIILKAFRKPGADKDYLFVVTHKFNIAVFEFVQREKVHIKTVAYGSIVDRADGLSDTGVLLDIDAKCRIAVLRIYSSHIHVINLDFKHGAKEELSYYNLPVEESTIINFAFLDPMHEMKPKHPILCILSSDHKNFNLKAHEITDDRCLRSTSFKQDCVELGANILIPVSEPYGGVILVGQETISYIKGPSDTYVIAPETLESAPITCYCEILHDTFLLGDMLGRLFFLNLIKESSNDFDLRFIELGIIAIPTSLSYLDNNYVFVGSKFGDSQFIRLTPNPGPDQEYIEVLDSFISLAPFNDMVLVDLDKQGQNQLVACCGTGKDGSLRIIRNGIGINEHASIDLEKCEGIWPISVEGKHHDHIVFRFPLETKVLKFVNSNIEQLEIPDLNSKNTVFIGNLNDNVLIHITESFVRLLSTEKFQKLHEWEAGREILHASVSGSQIVCSDWNRMYSLEVKDNRVELITHIEIQNEASCVDISSFSDGPSTLCSVTFWETGVLKIYSLPTLSVLYEQSLACRILIRSVLMTTLDDFNYVFVGMGDGTLLYFIIDPVTGVLTGRKKVTLGTKPIFLKHFYSNGTRNIFVCTDRPTVIYSSNNKLVFSTVNLRQVIHMSNLNSEAYPSSIIVANEHQIILGQIDQIQKLHILKVPFGEHPRCIAYQESTHTFGVSTLRYDRRMPDGSFAPVYPNCISATAANLNKNAFTVSHTPGSILNKLLFEYDVSHFLVLNQTTLEVLHAHKFGLQENILAACSCRLGDDPNYYYIVGTAYIVGTTEVSHGRIVMFQFQDGRLQQVMERETKGAPFALQEFNGKLLASINHSVSIFEWNSIQNELNDVCTLSNGINTVLFKTQGDFVLIADVVRSAKLFNFMQMSNDLELIAEHKEVAHPCHLEAIDDDNFILADYYQNITILHKQAGDGITNQSELVPRGRFHLGGLVSSFRKGSLVNSQSCEVLQNFCNEPILFGTIEGSLGMICQLKQDSYKFLHQLQERIIEHEKPIGNMPLKKFRQYVTSFRIEEMHNFIDGDLIESFLDFPREKMHQIVQDITLPFETTNDKLEEIIKIVEELSRIH